MNDIALKRLYEAGWTPDRKVDITPIEEAYASENMVIPDRLREFFTSYGFLVIYLLMPALKWAFDHPGIIAIEAETDPDNVASQKVLNYLSDHHGYNRSIKPGFVRD